MYLLASTFAKKRTNYLVSYYLFRFLLLFLYILRYHCYFSIIIIFLGGALRTSVVTYTNILLLKHTNVSFSSLYLEKAGLASQNTVHLETFTYVVSVFPPSNAIAMVKQVTTTYGMLNVHRPSTLLSV